MQTWLLRTAACHCLPPFSYSYTQISASLAQPAVAGNSPTMKTSPSHRAWTLCWFLFVLFIYLQDLSSASCFLLMILKLVVLAKCFALDILNLGRPFEMCENSNGFPVPTSIDPRMQTRTTHLNLTNKAEYWLCYGKWVLKEISNILPALWN